MSYFLAISLAAIFGCLVGIFGTCTYYTSADEAEYWDEEDYWK